MAVAKDTSINISAIVENNDGDSMQYITIIIYRIIWEMYPMIAYFRLGIRGRDWAF